MAAIDYKKEFRELYMPPKTPVMVTVPPIKFIMVDGAGDPNEEGGAFAGAVSVLYALSYTIKMSRMSGFVPEGYFEYVMPPLEGLWDMGDDTPGIDYSRKKDFRWTAMLRQPDFVTDELIAWAKGEALRKKKLDCSSALLRVYDEGLCAQCMHVGRYDDEPVTVSAIERFIAEQGFKNDISASRRHHEIYLGDPRRGDPAKRKTVLRIPVK